MIIGFDGSRAFTQKRTGTENYSYQLLKALARLPSPGGKTTGGQAKIDSKNQYIVYVRHLSLVTCHLSQNFLFKEISWPRLWTQGGLALKTFTEKLDVLFVPAHTLPIIRKPGLKTVVTVHDLGSEYLPSMHQFKQRAYLGLMQKYQLKTATKIIAVSKATKEDLVKKVGIKPENVRVVYEGYDQEMYNVQGTIYKNDVLANSLRPYYLFVGTVQPRKNLERVIIAFSRQRSDNYLVIVGQKGWMSDEIYKLPNKLGIESRVKFLGYVPDEKLPVLYSHAQALVFPSLFEGFGLPILEAQACGCPVITSDTSSMPEVAGGGAILVNPYDVNDIVKGMERVKREGERVKLIKKGFENIKRFSWEKAARETLKVLEEV